MSKAREVDVSIVMPAYGRASMIGDAIGSCQQIGTALHVEVIVVDDGSPDSLEAVVSPFGVRFHRLANNAGSSVARNVGMGMARGRFVKFLDSDDILTEGALSAEVALAEQNAADIVVSGWRSVTLQADGSSTVESTFDAPVFHSIPDDLLAGYAVPTSAALYRRAALRRAQWDPSLSKFNDWDFFIQAALGVESFATSPVRAYDWRSHAGDRITSAGSLLTDAGEFYEVLRKLLVGLEVRGELTEKRKRRAAQYLYKELRCMFRFDRRRALSVLSWINSLDPEFLPRDEERSRLFRLLGRIGLTRPALETYGLLRRLTDRFVDFSL